MKFLALLLLLPTTQIFANDNPFDHCKRATGHVSLLNCKIGVMDNLVKEVVGAKRLKVVSKRSQDYCSKYGKMRKLSPKLRLIALLDCEFRYKVKYYNLVIRYQR